MKPIVFLIITMVSSWLTSYAEKKVISIKNDNKTIINPNQPHAPAKVNIEAWIDESILTISFLQPEGDATITWETTEAYNPGDFTFTTEAPIIIDLTPYGEVTSFTIETEVGHTYIGTIE